MEMEESHRENEKPEIFNDHIELFAQTLDNSQNTKKTFTNF